MVKFKIATFVSGITGLHLVETGLATCPAAMSRRTPEPHPGYQPQPVLVPIYLKAANNEPLFEKVWIAS